MPASHATAKVRFNTHSSLRITRQHEDFTHALHGNFRSSVNFGRDGLA